MKAIFLFLIIISFTFNLFGQRENLRKLDEFGSATCEDVKMRLDQLAIALFNEPQSRGYVVVYEGKHARYIYGNNAKPILRYFLPAFGEATYLSQQMRQYLIESRGIPKEQVAFINGGLQDNYTVELWVASKGFSLPKIKPTLEKMNYRKGKPLPITCEEG